MFKLRDKLLGSVAHRHLLFVGDDDGADDKGGGGQQQQNTPPDINHNDPDPDADAGKQQAEGDKGADADAGAGDADGEGDKDGDADGGAGDDGKDNPVVPRKIMLRRVSEQARKIAERDQKIAELQARLTEGKKDGEPDDGKPGDGQIVFKSREEADKYIREEAARQAAEAEFTRQCNAVADAGDKIFGEDAFGESLDNLRLLTDDGQIPIALLNAALASDTPEQALYELGKNPENAERLLKMAPERRIAEVVKLGMKKATPAPKQRSQTPPPPKNLDGRGGAADDAGLGDDVDGETWLRNRNKQVQANRLRAANRGGGG
jgi:hypothetical protein